MIRVLIIGANGFIGTNLALSLSQKTDVRLTLFSRKFAPILQKLKSTFDVQIVEGDYKDTILLYDVLRDIDVVYHLVSSSVPANSWHNPISDIESNLIPSVKLLEMCVQAGVKKVIFTSSGGTVYGNQYGILNEDIAPKPFSPYGIVKLAIENFLEHFRIKYGLQYDIYRVSNPYGPHLDKLGFGVINTWLKSLSHHHKLVMYGDGSAKKDFIYIDDVVNLVASSLYRDLSQSDVFNICKGESVSLKELLDVISAVVPVKVELERIEAPKSDNKYVQLDNTKIIQKIGTYEFMSLREGIRKTWEYVKAADE